MIDEDVKATAIEFAKKNKNRLAKEFTDTAKYPPAKQAVSVFMAGSPGAGKTEYSKNFINFLENTTGRSLVRIDSDDIRSLMPEYIGSNSHLFQGATSLVVEKIHDLVLHQNQDFILDGTMAKYDKALNNIKRSIIKNRMVFIFYLYQDPKIAWEFTKAREKIENRNIPKTAFIEQFFGAKETIEQLLKYFDDKITVFLVNKNFKDNTVKNNIKVMPNSRIDDYLVISYTKDELIETL
jgi:hypothetical protein